MAFHSYPKQKPKNPINNMRELFLHNPDSGFFGILSHWIGMGFIFSLAFDLTIIGTFFLLLFFPAVLLMVIFD